MAEDEKGNDTDISLLKKTRISVSVDEALADILVVSYEYGVKIFRGILLDSTKRNLPCGVPNINPAFNIPLKNPDDDTLYSVNQRFAYLDPHSQKKKSMPNTSRYKSGKMTVRLRPRQVLCSKCKGICNENSENVSRKRKTSEPALSPPPPPPKRSINAPITRSVNILNNVNYGGGSNSSKRTLRGKDSSTPLVPSETKSGIDSNTNKKPLGNAHNDNSEQIDKKQSNNQKIPVSCPAKDVQLPPVKPKKTFKKKRNVGSTEAAGKDMNENDDVNKPQTQLPQPVGSLSTDTNTTANATTASATATTASATATTTSTVPSTRTIKISYGPQGEGTVLKIPAQIDNDIGNDSEENVDRAARRALKRAKKEAKRKVMLGSSPVYLSGNSPRCLSGGSPRHGISESNSSRYPVMTSCDLPKKRKHKKKKHKEDKNRKHKEGQVSLALNASKEQCITQTISINLKQLNSCSTSDKPDDLSSSDEHGEVVPNFPPSPSQPLMMRINSQTITSALGADGVRLLVGDVVWGKILGFPWWPGKILTLTNGGSQGIQAHVAWYGSSTTSFLQCDQLSHYLDNFKARYNKKKKGPYKEAIKQATAEAKENAENRVRQPLGNSPSHNIIQVVPPALASPRQIDVVS